MSEQQMSTSNYMPVLADSESFIGIRDAQEDEFVTNVELPGIGLFFAVYDGHGGNWVSIYLRDNFHIELAKCIKEAKKKYSRSSASESNSPHKSPQSPTASSTEGAPRSGSEDAESGSDTDTDTSMDVQEPEEDPLSPNYKGPSPWMLEGIRRAFRKVDARICAEARAKNLLGGSTAVIAILQRKPGTWGKLWVAHVGDSRGVLCRNGHALPLTRDHKPDRPDENIRIKKAGGTVGHLAGIARVVPPIKARGRSRMPITMLSLSRAFGDAELKVPVSPPLISASPEIRCISLEPTDIGFVLACDGVWDVLSNGEVIQVMLQCAPDPKTAAIRVVKTAYAAKSLDNLTCTIVYFPTLALASSPSGLSPRLGLAMCAGGPSPSSGDASPEDNEPYVPPTRTSLASPDPTKRAVLVDNHTKPTTYASPPVPARPAEDTPSPLSSAAERFVINMLGRSSAADEIFGTSPDLSYTRPPVRVTQSPAMSIPRQDAATATDSGWAPQPYSSSPSAAAFFGTSPRASLFSANAPILQSPRNSVLARNVDPGPGQPQHAHAFEDQPWKRSVSVPDMMALPNEVAPLRSGSSSLQNVLEEGEAAPMQAKEADVDMFAPSDDEDGN